MRKRIYSILLAIAMLATIIPITVLAENPPHTHDGYTAISSATELAALFTNGGSGYLTADITTNSDASRLIEAGKTVNLCLNGFVLTLGYNNSQNIGIKGNGVLNLYDCGTKTHKFSVGTNGLWTLDETSGTETVTGGVITGGQGGSGIAGAVYMASGAQFNMYGGNIVGNQASGKCGAVYVDGTSVFNMTGGNIIGNQAQYGGGIYVANGATVDITGGTIENNQASQAGGAVQVDGTFRMSGGTIKNNHSDNDGGGLSVNSNIGNVKLTGTAAILNNTAKNLGGGVTYYKNVSGKVTLGGSVQITGNKGGCNNSDGTTQNVYLFSGNNIINIGTGTDAPTSDMQVGITMETPGQFTNTTATSGDEQYFTSDNNNYRVKYKPDGFLQLENTTVADILPDDFPTCVDILPPNLWVNGNEVNMMVIPYSLVIFTLDGDGNPDYVELANDIRTATLTKNGTNYTYTNNGVTTTFLMSDNGLESIKIEGLTGEYVDFNGTYGEQHAHAFTYTANDNKLTATCTAGCDDGYDKNPLTLTLTAPSSLVYDRNAKTVTFADGEEDKWTTAGLQLPTITYTAKSGSSLTNDEAINAGSYTASITVDTNKTASLDFEITKATPYIKTTPAPNDIEYGEKLEKSTLFGGSVQISSTDSSVVGGLFEWTNPDTVPGIDDSEKTKYDVTFTPADTNNYNTVSCQVTIRVNHTHTPESENGQAPTEEASGWKDYYKCICGEYYEDATGNVKIPDLDAWKAEGGKGYIAKLVHGTDADNDHICDYCEKVISDHNGTLQKGTAATLESAGYKDYYKCSICGKLFEDKACKVEITNLDAWKAEGGNGYIAKLEPAPEPDPDPINYKVIEGANSVWVIAAGESPVFRSNADFSKFSHVLLDGKELAKKYYKAESGSTIITLTPEYTATLAVGKHTIEIVSTDGSASTVFYIEETIANTNGEGFALSTATMSSAFIGCNIIGLAVVFFELKKKKKVR